ISVRLPTRHDDANIVEILATTVSRHKVDGLGRRPMALSNHEYYLDSDEPREDGKELWTRISPHITPPAAVPAACGIRASVANERGPSR
ncbi:MAG TPA: hypothetical protein VNT76_12720, partial [Candidatus Binatus sp.]|nr:hypothetical protein [Candidatus Binatus sp.]